MTPSLFGNLDNSGKGSFHLSPFCLLNFQMMTESEGEQESIRVWQAFRHPRKLMAHQDGWLDRSHLAPPFTG